MTEEQEFKQAALTAGMLNLKAEFDNRFQKVVKDWQDAVEALWLNVDETWRAKNERSFFETALDQIDNGYGAVGKKITIGNGKSEVFYAPHHNIGGHINEMLKQDFVQKETVPYGINVPHDNISGHEVVKDWTNATLEDVPVDWMPEKHGKYWTTDLRFECSNNCQSCLFEHKSHYGRLFPTKKLAQMYLDSQKPVERWKPEYGMWYYIVDRNGGIDRCQWHDDTFDLKCWDFGNIFHTEQEAIAARDRVKKALKGE